MAVDMNDFTADAARSSLDDVAKALPEILADLYAKIAAHETRLDDLEAA